ncbi:MAG: DUF3772 domain-containing protein [Hyphomicrobiaceae bacterium]
MRRLFVRSLLVVCLLVVGGLTRQLEAQTASSPGANAGAPTLPGDKKLLDAAAEAIAPVERLSKSIQTAENAIKQLKELEGELGRLRAEVERIIYDSTATAENLRPQLAEVKKQIARLGPPPGKDQPPEPATITAERQRLNELAGNLDGAIKTTELAWLRAKQLIDRITVIRYQMFARNLLERRSSPMLPAVWHDVGDSMDLIMGRIAYYGGDWVTWATKVWQWLAALCAGALGLWLIGGALVRRWLARCLVRPDPIPTFFQRVSRAAWMAPVRLLPPVAAVCLLYAGLAQLDLLFSPWTRLAIAIFTGALIYFLATTVVSVAFQPRHPAWRLVPVSDRTARHIQRIAKAFFALYVLDTAVVELGRAVYVPLSVTVAQTALSSLAFALLLITLFFTRFVPMSGADRPVNGHVASTGPTPVLAPRWIKIPILIVALVILGAAALGYIALARFVAHQVVLSGTVLATAGLAYLAIRAITRGRADNSDMVGQTLQSRFGLVDPARRRQLSRLLEALLTIMVLLATIPALLVQWGFSAADVRDWAIALLFGFDVGQFHISLVRILVAIALFTGLLFLTRVVQRWLRERILAQPRVDQGIANSVETAVGYAGISVALLIALSWAGLDITSLAIVAGALSVGIGFGLQSIVNNFVSGLILLVERPIKVGDWVVVGAEQGNVRRISVRSTEIETFDKASLIVPNSELITGRVLNWTHRTPLGRAVVKVRVSPSADPEAVIEIIRQCVETNGNILTDNPPFITFDDFDGVALAFTVRSVVGDVYQAARVASAQRIAILKRLRAEGIQLANPQHDVHLKDLDWVKATASRLAEQKSEAPRAPPPGSNDND